MKNFFMNLVQFSLLSKLPREEPILSKPDPNLVVNHTLPVKVFIFTGQSNMQGHGRIWGQDVQGTVEYITKTEGKYRHLLNEEGDSWSIRNNVYTAYRNGDASYENIGPLKVGAGTEDGLLIGPELQIGQILGETLDDNRNSPILLIKVGTGNRALGWDFLPPGTVQREFNGDDLVAAHGQCPSRFAKTATLGNPNSSQCGCVAGASGCNVFWEKEACLVDNCWCKETNSCPKWYAGYQYDDDKDNIHYILRNIGHYVPGYQNQGFQVSGFFFWQGYSDTLNGAHAHFYQENLVHYIQAMRDEFAQYNHNNKSTGQTYVPPFVLATIGHKGCDESQWLNDAIRVREAQTNVATTEPRVATIDSRVFWRNRNESPLDDLPHYHRNANVFLEVGTKMGWAMADILQNEFRLVPPVCPKDKQ